MIRRNEELESIWRDRIGFWPEFLALQNIPSRDMRFCHRSWIQNVLRPLSGNVHPKNEELD